MKRKVIVFDYVKNENGIYKLEPRAEHATFHKFGCDYEEFENGVGNYTTAIIECPDGTVENLAVHRIKFLEPRSKP